MSDEEIVTLALGDRSYFRLIYQRYADRLYRYAISRTGSHVVADDVVSESMLAALEHLDRWDPRRGTFATWLFVIAQRKIIDQQRAHRRILRIIGKVQQSWVSRTEPDALEGLLAAERASEVQGAIAALGSSDQEVIGLRFAAGLSGSEISDVLGIQPAAARKRLSRAMQRLEQQLEARDE